MANKQYASPRVQQRRFLIRTHSSKRAVAPTSKHTVTEETTTSSHNDPVTLTQQPSPTQQRVKRRVSLALVRGSIDHAPSSSRKLINSSISISRHSSSQTTAQNPTKTVRFPEDKDELETVIATLPRMKKKDRCRVYWSRREISRIKAQATNIAEAMARKNVNVLYCIHHCYGILPDPVLLALTRQQKTDMEVRDFVTEWLASPENAMRYYYSYQVKEAQNNSSEFFLPEDQKSQRDTTVRGLEHQMSFEIGDYRARCIHAVLNAQEDIRRKLGIADTRIVPLELMEQLQAALARQSEKASRKARRFARLLGKADSAIVGTRNGINKPK